MALTPLRITVIALMGLSALLWIIGVSTDSLASVDAVFWKFESARLFPGRGQDGLPDYWKSSQAFALLGLFALGAAAVLSVLTLCLKDTGRRFVLILQTAALFGSTACITLCVIILGAKLTEIWKPLTVHFGYSYVLICVSAGFVAIAGIVCLVDLIMGD